MKDILGVVRAEFYKLGRAKVLWCMPLLFAAFGIYYATMDFEVFRLYSGLDLFVLPTLANSYFMLFVLILAGYFIGMDYTGKTIKNVLSVGVSRRAYYFSRLGVLFLLIAVLYGTGMLGYVWGRGIFYPAESVQPKMELFGVKLAVCIMVSVLQLWADAAMVNAACYFMKRQLPSTLVGALVMYIELVIRQLANLYGFTSVSGAFDFAPVRVLKNTFEVYAMYDRILTFDYLKFAISALFLIVVSSVVGFIKFRFFPGND